MNVNTITPSPNIVQNVIFLQKNDNSWPFTLNLEIFHVIIVLIVTAMFP